MKNYEFISKSIEERFRSGQYDHADCDNQSSCKSNRPKRNRKQTNRFIDETSKEYRERDQQRRRRGTSASIENNEYEESNESEDDEKLAPRSSKRKKNAFILEDSSSDDDDDLSKEYERHQNLMKKRKDNIDTGKWVQDDINGSTNQSVGERGAEFNLVQAMKMVEEEEDNEGIDIEETRYQLQRQYNNNQLAKNQQLASRLEDDRITTSEEPLYDADLSDEEEERVNRNQGLSIGNIQVNGSNNNISINLAQPMDMPTQKRNDSMMYHSHFRYISPPIYQSQYTNQVIDESVQQIHPSYHTTPRFLAMSANSQQPTRTFPIHTSTVSTIKSKVSAYFHLLSPKDKLWVGKLVDIAMLTDNRRPVTISQRTWVYNERSRHSENEWKGDLIRTVNHLLIK